MRRVPASIVIGICPSASARHAAICSIAKASAGVRTMPQHLLSKLCLAIALTEGVDSTDFDLVTQQTGERKNVAPEMIRGEHALARRSPRLKQLLPAGPMARVATGVEPSPCPPRTPEIGCPRDGTGKGGREVGDQRGSFSTTRHVVGGRGGEISVRVAYLVTV